MTVVYRMLTEDISWELLADIESMSDALMFLRSYTGLSDAGLVEMLNGNLHMQMFCGVLIDPSAPIRDGRIVSATIYANNENRTYCTKAGIVTSFVRKGPHPREEGTRNVRRIIGNLRATLMEGSFGNQKQHYGVSRIAARNRASETLQLFFAIHMANAVILAERRRKREEETEQQRSA